MKNKTNLKEIVNQFETQRSRKKFLYYLISRKPKFIDSKKLIETYLQESGPDYEIARYAKDYGLNDVEIDIYLQCDPPRPDLAALAAAKSNNSRTLKLYEECFSQFRRYAFHASSLLQEASGVIPNNEIEKFRKKALKECIKRGHYEYAALYLEKDPEKSIGYFLKIGDTFEAAKKAKSMGDEKRAKEFAISYLKSREKVGKKDSDGPVQDYLFIAEEFGVNELVQKYRMQVISKAKKQGRYDIIGKIYEQMGDLEEALINYEKAEYGDYSEQIYEIYRFLKEHRDKFPNKEKLISFLEKMYQKRIQNFKKSKT